MPCWIKSVHTVWHVPSPDSHGREGINRQFHCSSGPPIQREPPLKSLNDLGSTSEYIILPTKNGTNWTCTRCRSSFQRRKSGIGCHDFAFGNDPVASSHTCRPFTCANAISRFSRTFNERDSVEKL